MSGVLNWNLDPVIVMITDSFPLKYYGALFASGLLLGYYIVRTIYKKEKLPLPEAFLIKLLSLYNLSIVSSTTTLTYLDDLKKLNESKHLHLSCVNQCIS